MGMFSKWKEWNEARKREPNIKLTIHWSEVKPFSCDWAKSAFLVVPSCLVIVAPWSLVQPLTSNQDKLAALFDIPGYSHCEVEVLP